MLIDVYRGQIADVQRAGSGGQAEVTGEGGRVGLDVAGDRLADLQLLADDGLGFRLGGVDIEDKIGAGIAQFILKIDCELDANHEFPVVWPASNLGEACPVTV